MTAPPPPTRRTPRATPADRPAAEPALPPGLGLGSPDRPTAYRLTAVAAALAGLGVWFALRDKGVVPNGFDDVPTGLGTTMSNVWILTALLAAVPAVRRRVGQLLGDVARPSPARRRLTALTIAAVSAVGFVALALLQGHDLLPSWHDEQSYLIAAQMLAEGRLWMPAHPLAEFFDSFYILVRPVYASMYFPGAALMYVPAIWLGVPPELLAAAVAGGVVGLTYRVVTELADGAAGLLAALLVATCLPLQVLAAMVMSHPPLMLLALLAVWAWLHWRRAVPVGADDADDVEPEPPRRTRPWAVGGWALAMGAFAGWAAVTRPIDAAALLFPVSVAVLIRLWRHAPRLPANVGAARARATVAALTVAAGLAGLAPFLALQAVQNWGVTGSWHRYPHDLYVARDMPGVEFGFHRPDPTARPESDLPQKQVFHATWTYPTALTHTPSRMAFDWWYRRLPYTGGAVVPAVALAALAPLGALGLAASRRRDRWAAAVVLPASIATLLLAYVFYAFYMPYYPVVVAPAVALLVAAAPAGLARALPPRHRVGALATVALVIAGAAAGQIASRLSSGFYPSPFSEELASIDAALSAIDRPSVVLFRFEPGNSPHAEPVYNTSVAWPDDAFVIRAHDRGAENARLIAYYGERDPDRDLYLYLRGERRLVPLGRAGDLLARLSPATRE